jgi:vanillate O-demethylase monooxygenase subunit
MGDGARIPERMRLQTFLSAERYGFVWACLKEQPTRPLPHWPMLEPVGSGWKRIEHPRERWKASAGRQCENFNDVAHFAWVHLKTFGNPGRPEIAPYDVQRTEYGLRAEIPYVEVERGFNSDVQGERSVRYTYELTYPYATQLRVDYNAETTSYFYDVASPISATECEVYGMSLTNSPDAGDDYADYSLLINQEDRPLVEGQVPSLVPLGPGDEVSTPSDRLSIQYRRDLVELFGLGAQARA